jgi:hypothetical protein
MNELTPKARMIVESGRAALEPSEAMRARMREAVSSRITQASAGAGAVATATSGGAVSTAKLIIVSSIVVGFLAGGIVVWRGVRHSNDAPAPNRRASGAVVNPPPVEQPASPAPEVSTESVASPPVALPQVARRKTRVAPPATPPAPPPDLAIELAFLDRARAALRNGDPGAALGELDALKRKVAAPQMEREALLLRAESLCASQDVSEGTQLLDSVEARWPAASGIDAVRSHCQKGRR